MFNSKIEETNTDKKHNNKLRVIVQEKADIQHEKLASLSYSMSMSHSAVCRTLITELYFILGVIC